MPPHTPISFALALSSLNVLLIFSVPLDCLILRLFGIFDFLSRCAVISSDRCSEKNYCYDSEADCRGKRQLCDCAGVHILLLMAEYGLDDADKRSEHGNDADDGNAKCDVREICRHSKIPY